MVMRVLPCFAWIHSDVSETLLSILCLQQEQLLVFEFLKQNLAIFCSFFTGIAFGADMFHHSHLDVVRSYKRP